MVSCCYDTEALSLVIRILKDGITFQEGTNSSSGIYSGTAIIFSNVS